MPKERRRSANEPELLCDFGHSADGACHIRAESLSVSGISWGKGASEADERSGRYSSRLRHGGADHLLPKGRTGGF